VGGLGVFWWREQVDEGLWVGFTNTAAGNLALHVGDDPEAVLGRRRGLESAAGIRGEGLRFMSQVHSANVGTARPSEPTEGPAEVDALVAPDGDVPLAVMVADCLPVVFTARTGRGHATAVAHAGRRGLLDGILVNTARQLQSAGGLDLRAWIGPAICGRCYEVPAAMREEAAAVLPGLGSETSWGTPALDLPAGAARQLASLGVKATRIDACTLEHTGLFSYRRDQSTGRFAGLVWAES
jgi:polyphenol oxidase